METISKARAHGGTQGVYKHDAKTTGCPMTFAVFVPPQAENGPVPVLWYLSPASPAPMPTSWTRASTAAPPLSMA